MYDANAKWPLGRGIRFSSGESHVAENVSFLFSNGGNPSPVLEVFENCGSATFRDCSITLDGHGGRLINFFNVATPGDHDSTRVKLLGGEISGSLDAGNSTVAYIKRATVDGVEVNLTTTGANRTFLLESGAQVYNCDMTVDHRPIRAYSSVDQIVVSNNRLESTVGDSELALEGSDNVAIGNLLSNGIGSISGVEANNHVIP